MASIKLCRLPHRLRRADLERRSPRSKFFKDRTGTVVDGCQIVGFAGFSPHGFSAWLCRCRCGKLFLSTSCNLNAGRASCGCRRYTQEGLSTSYHYWIWRRIIANCHDSAAPSYAAYGGEGVTVCERWRNSLKLFITDVGPRPTPRHQLELINYSRGFRPSNVRWMTVAERLLLGRRMVVIEHAGRRMGVGDWADFLGTSPQLLSNRLEKCRRLGADPAEAVSTPIGQRMPCMAAFMERRRQERKRQAKTRK